MLADVVAIIGTQDIVFGEIDRAITERGDQTIAELLARQTGHLYALAGELAAIGSLVGASDPGLPGRLAYSTGQREVAAR